MERLRRTISAIGLIVLIGLLAIVPLTAMASDISGRGLLEGMAKVADRHAQASWAQGRIEDSVNWSSWALVYRSQLRGVPANMTAAHLAQHGIQASRRYALQSAQIGNAQLARFYTASATFWQDINQQITRGSVPIQVRFPQEMLMQINGAPGTPWAPLGETRLPGSSGLADRPSGGIPMGGPAPVGGSPSRGQICPACGGVGKSVCFTCKGTGEENYQAFANFYGLSDDAAESLARRTRYTCTGCGGSGFKKCIACGGSGRLGVR